MVSATAFTNPINGALQAGVPVVTYNANGSTADPTNGMAYIGQELYVSGQAVGQRLASLMTKGDTAVGFIAQPGALNIQPRMDGATQALEAAGMKVMGGNKGIDTGASATQEAQVLPQYLQANGSKIQGAFAVDGGDTALLGTSLAKYNLVGKVHAGGFDLEPQTLTAIKAGQIDFTVDQSAVPAGLPAHAVPLPVAAVRRPDRSAGDEHRPEVRHQGQRGPVHRARRPGTRARRRSRSTSSTAGRSRPDHLTARHWVGQGPRRLTGGESSGEPPRHLGMTGTTGIRRHSRIG